MRRALALAADYATRRVAFGRPLAAHPLHVETLAAMAVEYEGAFHLTFHLGALLGKEECDEASDEELLLLRLLTPVAKLYTGKQAVAVASEALEAFGGAGYVEDTGLPRLLRDAQVLSIWEGTTNVLSLDVLRAMGGEGDALGAFRAAVARRLDALTEPTLRALAPRVAEALRRIDADAESAALADAAYRQAGARGLAYALARTYVASLLLEHADWCARRDPGEGPRAATAAARWCAQDLAPLGAPDEAHRTASASLVCAASLAPRAAVTLS